MRPTPLLILLLLLCSPLLAQTTRPSTSPSDKLPFLHVDIAQKTIRMECLAVKADYALEFYCVVAGTNEYEAIVSSRAKPSHLHLALLMIGLEPGNCLRYDSDKLILPKGPALDISMEWLKDGKTVRYPAYRLMRNLKTKQEAPAMTWCFAGSRLSENNAYLADLTGYLVSTTNVDGMVIDLSQRVSNAMDDRLWEPNSDLMPEPGTKVWMIIQPAAPTTQPATKPSR